MPEHVHLLISEPERGTLASAIQAIKQSVARRLIGGREHFWQARYYDFNVWTAKKRIEKLRYITSQPGQARTGGKTRRLGVEQLPALRDRNGRRGGDRVGMD